MPTKGERAEWEGEANRSKIFMSLSKEPKTFTALLMDTGLSRSSLSLHLKNLQNAGVIEKAIKNDEIVYQTKPNEEKWLAEVKKMSFDFALTYLMAINPQMGALFVAMSNVLVKVAVSKRKKEIELGRNLSTDEVVQLGREVVKQMTKEYSELSKDPEKFAKEFIPMPLEDYAKMLEIVEKTKIVELMKGLK